LKISDPMTVNSNKSVSQTGTGSVVFESTVTLQTGASLNVSSPTFVHQLSAASGASATVAAGTGVLRVDSASLASGAKIDLTNNKLITADAAGSWNGSAYTGVAGQVAAGRNGGQWNGSGITTSSATPGNNLTTLGTAKVGDFKGIAASATTTFAGQTVHGSDTVVMYTYGGDANLDGKINIDDYGRIDGNVGIAGASGWYNGDFNYDGKVNIDDYGIIDGNIGVQGAPFSTAGSAALPSGVSAVPEPVALAPLMLGGLAVLRSRRRRCC